MFAESGPKGRVLIATTGRSWITARKIVRSEGPVVAFTVGPSGLTNSFRPSCSTTFRSWLLNGGPADLKSRTTALRLNRRLRLRRTLVCVLPSRCVFGLSRDPCECESPVRQRSDLPVRIGGILAEADYLTVSSGQHYDANRIRLRIRRGHCVQVSHANGEGFFFCDDFDCPQHVVLILTSIVSERFCKLPFSLCSLSCFGSDGLLSAFVPLNSLPELLRVVRFEILCSQPPVVSIRSEHICQASSQRVA